MTIRKLFMMFLAMTAITCLILITQFSISSVQAASAQQWEYGMYVTGEDVHLWVELNDEDEKTVQDIIAGDTNPNIISVFNLLGVLGWEFSGADKQEPLTLYIFKRPAE